MQRAIPATMMRGGTSRGLYFNASDLPVDTATRDRVLLSVMGSPDMRQIDGVGGAHPLTSKVAVLSESTHPDADVDYLFLQVAVDKAEVSDVQNCGNILAGVGPWAIEQGIVPATEGTTDVRIHMVNSSALSVATVSTPNKVVAYHGDAHIDGVPGTAAPVALNFLDVAGSSCGALLATGNVVDIVNGIEMTCIDNGMPVVVMRATDFGKTGYETPQQLESDTTLKTRIEEIRTEIAKRMNLGDVSNKTVPKMCLIAPPVNSGAVCTRNFIPHRVHEAIGVLGAVSVATACLLPGSVSEGIAVIENTDQNGSGKKNIVVEHPTGSFTIAMVVDHTGNTAEVKQAALLRTCRKLFAGEVYIAASEWPVTDNYADHTASQI